MPAVGVSGVGIRGVGGVATRRCDRALELVDGGIARTSQPLVLIAWAGDGADGAHLRPREVGAVEGIGDAWKSVEAVCDPRGILQRACGKADALACVVAEPDESDATVGAASKNLARDNPELVTGRGFHPARDPQLDVDVAREAGALGEQRSLALGVSVSVRRGRPVPRPRTCAVSGSSPDA